MLVYSSTTTPYSLLIPCWKTIGVQFVCIYLHGTLVSGPFLLFPYVSNFAFYFLCQSQDSKISYFINVLNNLKSKNQCHFKSLCSPYQSLVTVIPVHFLFFSFKAAEQQPGILKTKKQTNRKHNSADISTYLCWSLTICFRFRETWAQIQPLLVVNYLAFFKLLIWAAVYASVKSEYYLQFGSLNTYIFNLLRMK